MLELTAKSPRLEQWQRHWVVWKGTSAEGFVSSLGVSRQAKSYVAKHTNEGPSDPDDSC